jgi:WD40 repeat protein
VAAFGLTSSAAFARDDGGLFFTGKEDETARIWDARTGEPIGIGGPENFLRRAR